MTKQNAKKKHHYIPVFYLSGFANSKDSLWVYDKNDKGMFESSPEGIAFEKDYFSFSTPDGEKDSETVENKMMEMEGEFSKVVKKILSKETLTDDERVTFAYFVSSMMVRVPNFRNNIRSSTEQMMTHLSTFMAAHKENFEGSIKRYERDTGNKIGMPIEELRQWMLDPKNYKITVNTEYATGMALSLMEKFVGGFFNMKWAFLRAGADDKFMCGDNPLHYDDPTHDRQSFYGVGLANKNIEVTLPLSRDVCAFGTWAGHEGHMIVQNKHVRHINRMTVIASARFVFADIKSETIDKFVKKYKGSHPVLKVN